MNDRQLHQGDQVKRQNPAYGQLRPRRWSSRSTGARLCCRLEGAGYCEANTKGTFTVVEPLDAGKRQPWTRLPMQLARPW